MSLFAELRRRNVVRVGIFYVALSWLILQVADVVFGVTQVPDWSLTLVAIILGLGFIPSLIFAWVFELTPEGLKRERDVDRSQSVTNQTARKLDIAVIVVVLIAISLLAADRIYRPIPSEKATVSSSGTHEPAASVSNSDGYIAVLPFVNMSADPENEFFADGVTEEILNRLAQVPQLNVIARTSSFAFKGDNRDVREIGRTLGASNVLEGSVRRQGDQVRITAQLITTDAGTHLWSDNFDRTLDDIFAVQDEIAEAVAQALDVVLDEDARAAMRNAGIRDVEAFVAYQRGRKLAHDAHNERDIVAAMVPAVAEFDRAIERVPGFAAAYLEKSDYYAHIILEPDFEDAERTQAIEDMRALLDQARRVARDPGMLTWIDLDRALFADNWEGLPAVADRALASPDCFQSNWFEMLFPFGFDEALVEHQQRMRECDPLTLITYANLGYLALRRGDVEAAEAQLRAGEALGAHHRWLRGLRREIAAYRGDWDVLLDDLDESESPPEVVTARRAAVLGAMGRVGEGRVLMASLGPKPPVSLSRQIDAHASLGNHAAANLAASKLDARPGGALELIRVINRCHCGAPFDLEATPNLGTRIAEAGFPWPPPSIYELPAKDW